MNEENNVTEDYGFEDIVNQLTEVPATDGNVVNESPVEDSTPAEVEAEPTEEVTDELDSIVDDLTGEDDTEVEAGDDPENEDETEEESSEEQEEGDDQEHVVKIDGEEHTVSLSELKKGYGLQQSLTRKGQELAETRKQLDAESEAIAWAKAQPEARKLAEQIQEAHEAVQRGFVFGEDGEQIRLTREQIEETQKNIEDAQGKLGEMAKPPRLEELQEAIPDMFVPEKAAETLKPYGDTLRDFGYAEAEILSHNDPRTFLMLKELHELRDLASRVEKAKARRKEEKPTIASKPTKAAKDAPSKSKTGEAKPQLKAETVLERINNGEANASDMFMDL